MWGKDLGRKVRRKDTLTPGWAALFKLMEVLAGVYGEEFVRLVAWFDSE